MMQLKVFIIFPLQRRLDYKTKNKKERAVKTERMLCETNTETEELRPKKKKKKTESREHWGQIVSFVVT